MTTIYLCSLLLPVFKGLFAFGHIFRRKKETAVATNTANAAGSTSTVGHVAIFIFAIERAIRVFIKYHTYMFILLLI